MQKRGVAMSRVFGCAAWQRQAGLTIDIKPTDKLLSHRKHHVLVIRRRTLQAQIVSYRDDDILDRHYRASDTVIPLPAGYTHAGVRTVVQELEGYLLRCVDGDREYDEATLKDWLEAELFGHAYVLADASTWCLERFCLQDLLVLRAMRDALGAAFVVDQIIDHMASEARDRFSP